jgi:hypothetical protein
MWCDVRCKDWILWFVGHRQLLASPYSGCASLVPFWSMYFCGRERQKKGFCSYRFDFVCHFCLPLINLFIYSSVTLEDFSSWRLRSVTLEQLHAFNKSTSLYVIGTSDSSQVLRIKWWITSNEWGNFFNPYGTNNEAPRLSYLLPRVVW